MEAGWNVKTPGTLVGKDVVTVIVIDLSAVLGNIYDRVMHSQPSACIAYQTSGVYRDCAAHAGGQATLCRHGGCETAVHRRLSMLLRACQGLRCRIPTTCPATNNKLS